MSKLIFKKFETIFISLLFFTFILGFYLGWNNSDNNLKNFKTNFETSQLDLKSTYESFEFYKNFQNESCNLNNLNYLSNKIYNSGIKLEKLEKNKKINNENYKYLKIRHNINQVLLYTQYKKFNDNCNVSNNIILFFFNSSKPILAKQQGEEISKLVKKYNLKVFPIDYGYTQNLDYFYKFYNIKKLPSLIINFNKTNQGIINSKQIEKELNN